MNQSNLIAAWKREERIPFSGWDFSCLEGRIFEESPPWDYLAQAAALLDTSRAVLEMDTGGGERFLTLHKHWPPITVATENYPPNLALAHQRLSPLGADVIDMHVDDLSVIPFADATFDLVLNRHSGFCAAEVARVLAPGGSFLTQQVHGLWAQDLIAAFDARPQWPDASPERYVPRLQAAGLEIVDVQEWQGELSFADVSTIVFYLKAVPWTVPNFSVDTHLDHLLKLQARLDAGERLVFEDRKYLIAAYKPA